MPFNLNINFKRKTSTVATYFPIENSRNFSLNHFEVISFGSRYGFSTKMNVFSLTLNLKAL